MNGYDVILIAIHATPWWAWFLAGVVVGEISAVLVLNFVSDGKGN